MEMLSGKKAGCHVVKMYMCVYLDVSFRFVSFRVSVASFALCSISFSVKYCQLVVVVD